MTASMREGRVKVMLPQGLAPDEESWLIDDLVDRVIRKATSREIDLVKRAAQLANKYDLPVPDEVTWSPRQKRIWGSCSPEQGRVRISERLATVPGWVLDSVLVHELAHIAVPDHGAAFQDLINRYELAERATGYLIALGEQPPIDDAAAEPQPGFE